MPSYRCRSLTENGVIVTSRIEEVSRKAVISRLKRNNLVPITIREELDIKKTNKKKKRNIKDIQDIIKNGNKVT